MPKKKNRLKPELRSLSYLDSLGKAQSEKTRTCISNGENGGALVLREGRGVDGNRPYDLLERTAQFGEAIVRFAKKIPQNPVNNRLIAQLVGAGTSIGAKFCEADDAVS